MNAITITLMLIAVLLAFRCQKKKFTNQDGEDGLVTYGYFDTKLFVLSFLILGFTCFFCKSGVDIPNYVNYYNTWTWSSLSDVSREVGYKVVNIILSSFIKNPYIGLGIIKLLSIGLVFYAAYIVREKINVGVAILSYCCLLYIYNFQIMRMMLAIGIVFVSLSNEMLGNSKRCLFGLILAFAFHYSSIFALVAYVGAKIIGKKITWWKVIILVGVIIAFMNNSSYLITYFQRNITFFNKYEAYTREMSQGSGWGQFILFIPVAWLLFYHYQKEHEEKEYSISFIWGIMTYVCGALGYLLPITRMTYYFYYFFFYYCASLCMKRENKYLRIGTKTIGLETFIVVFYLIFMFVSYISKGGIQSNGLEQYIFIWE